MAHTFDDLVAEAADASVEGWDFSWLDGRGSEQRPSWGYQKLMSQRLASAAAGLDVQTGGGEVLAGAERFPATMAATEGFPPNAARAAGRLHPRGVVLVVSAEDAPFPFADEAFDLVTSRHPNTVQWAEIARVLRPGGTYLAQQIGPDSGSDLVEHFLGPRAPTRNELHPDTQTEQATGAGLRIADARMERLRMEFFDIGAVIYFLRKVIWMVPDFTVDGYRQQLRELHDRIEAEGSFVTHSSRVLIDAHKPGA